MKLFRKKETDNTKPKERRLYNYERVWDIFRKYRKQIKIIVLSIVLAVAIVVLSSILISYTNKLSKQYNDLTKKMNTLNESSFDSINYYLENLPKKYKDLPTIKEEYKYILKRYKELDIHTTDLDFKSKMARTAFLDLSNFDKEHDNWNLKSLLSKYTIIETIIYGVEFKEITDTNYSFLYSSNEDGEYILKTDIPNKKDPSKEYYFYTQVKGLRLYFGYMNVNDSDESFLSYIINSCYCLDNDLYLEIHCNSNNINYVLKYTIEVE